ncbi:MAG: hypothetical protein Q4D14_02450 [Bacteroidales bacterium]|nr:hypothetical protein [Bacteroidales bacterium]
MAARIREGMNHIDHKLEVDYDCSLLLEQIVGHTSVGGQSIPLQSKDLWLKYYELMGRQ